MHADVSILVKETDVHMFVKVALIHIPRNIGVAGHF